MQWNQIALQQMSTIQEKEREKGVEMHNLDLFHKWTAVESLDLLGPSFFFNNNVKDVPQLSQHLSGSLPSCNLGMFKDKQMSTSQEKKIEGTKSIKAAQKKIGTFMQRSSSISPSP